LLKDAPFNHNTYATDDRRTQYCSISAAVVVRSAEKH